MNVLTLHAPRVVIASDDAADQERYVIRFCTWQLVALLYTQKFAIGPPSFQLSVPMLIMSIGLVYAMVQRRISLSQVRLGLYFIFIGFLILSQILANTAGSIPSMAELMLIYFFVTASAPLSEKGYFRILNNYVLMMIAPALIGLAQYGIQKITGGGDPISIEPFFPRSLLLQGFYYDAHYPMWYDVFQRPNGFFFLEPSFFSLFTAAAAIIEITYFRRPVIVILMVMATFLSFGGTGLTMFVVALPILLLRESPRLMVPLVIVLVVGVAVALMMGANLPLISRLNELDTAGASGGMRLIVPLTNLIELLSDPSYLFTGSGAGTTTADMGSAWPMLKLVKEYGIITMVAFLLLYGATFVSGSYNWPLKIAAIVIFNFTGGYLHDSITIQFFTIMFCMTEPTRKSIS